MNASELSTEGSMTTNYSYLYGFTIKDNRANSEEYDSALEHLRKFGTITACYAESRTKTGVPTKKHLHGTLGTMDKLYYKGVKLPGYMFFFRKHYSAHWEKYISKSVYEPDWNVYQFSKSQ